MTTPRKLSDYVPILADQEIDYVAIAQTDNVVTFGLEGTTAAQADGNVELTLPYEMANTDYRVAIGNRTDADVVLRVEAKTTTTVTIQHTAGTAAITFDLVVVGQRATP